MELELIHEQASLTPNAVSVYLVCVVKDEFLLWDYFIRSHRDLGVTQFIMIDNL